MLKHIIQLCFLSAVLGVLSYFIHPNPPNYNAKSKWELSVIDLGSFQEDLLWVDAREEAEYSKGHIPGAVLLDEYNWDECFDQFMTVWDGEMAVVVYCDSLECGKSESLAKTLRDDYGIEKVYFLKGGWKEWQANQ